MKQAVLLFARARDLAGAEKIEIELPDEARISDVRQGLLRFVPALAPLAQSLLFAVDNNYAADETLVPLNAEIACFPPVSGG